jgi:hypothetical protein
MSAPYHGWHSTKLHLALITMALMSIAYAWTGFSPALFGEFCMGLCAAAGIYSGSSVVEKLKGKSKVDAPE